MIKSLALTDNLDLLIDEPFERLHESDITWFWMDICDLHEIELSVLKDQFQFHHLAIEDCLLINNRPKVDFYDSYSFFVLNMINLNTITTEDVNLFIGENYVVSVHMNQNSEMSQLIEKVKNKTNIWVEGHLYITYLIFDIIVDQYFPAVYKIEDYLGNIVIRAGGNIRESVISSVFDLREDLLKLRRTVNSMKELLYRILNSERLQDFRKSNYYFNDINNHLVKLLDIIDSNREMTADMRDSYLSINSHRMNKIMTILTIVTSIFIPLTFIVGVYGMNFDTMPELRWKYSYFIVWGVMILIGIMMFLLFKIKGWLDIYK